MLEERFHSKICSDFGAGGGAGADMVFSGVLTGSEMGIGAPVRWELP